MVLTKGPAALPVVVAALAAPCILARSFRPLRRPALLLAALIPAALLTLAALAISSALDRTNRPIVTQSAGEFLWDLREVDEILTLPLIALFSMLPASLALLLIPWRHPADPRDHAARTLALALLLSIALFTILGVSNPRYTLPAAALAPPLAAWALSRYSGATGPLPARASGGVRHQRLFRALILFHPATWPTLLSAAFILFLIYYEAPRGRTSGDAAGAALAAILEPAASAGATVWVDQLVECRPEVLLYARRFTPLLDIRWVKPLEAAPARPGDILITRTDRHDTTEATERDRCAELVGDATRIHEFPVHKYHFEVRRLPLDASMPPASMPSSPTLTPPADRPAAPPPSPPSP
jgi:hypothetical protein